MYRIGSKKVNELLSDALEAISYLGSEPSTTEDFVSYITFVDKSQQRVENMDARLDYIKEIYDIMEEYHIPIPAEDFANYLVSTLAQFFFFTNIYFRNYQK